MVNGTEHIFVERQGRVEELEKHFDSVGQLEDLIQQIVSRVNRTVNLASPIADARLEDGSRVHVSAGTGGVKWADFNDPEVPGTDHDGTPD